MKSLIILVAVIAAVSAAPSLKLKSEEELYKEVMVIQERGLKEIVLKACEVAVGVLGTSCSVFTTTASMHDTACKAVATALNLIWFLPGSYSTYYSGCMTAVSLTNTYCQGTTQNQAPHNYLCNMLYNLING